MGSPHHFDEAHLYPTHIIFGTRFRVPHFKDEELALACLKAIENERKRISLDILAYTLMLDHAHFVIGPVQLKLGQLVHALKNASVHKLKALELVGGGLWQRGYFDRGLRDVAQVREAIDYVHRNPVAAGLVEDAIAYRFSSFREYEGGFDGPITLSPHLLS